MCPRKAFRLRVNGKVSGRYNTSLYATIQRNAHEAKGRHVTVEYWCNGAWHYIYSSGGDNRRAAKNYAQAVITGAWPSNP